MFLWFAGLSVVGVVTVFQSPGIDYRLVMLGAVLPVGEGVLGHPYVLHTLLGAVTALVLTVVATRRRRLLRRRLLGLSIGLFAHLVLDGVWMRRELFWWPLFGTSFGSAQVPELTRSSLGVILELVGVAALTWCWMRFDLGNTDRRQHFFSTGRLDR